MRGKVVPCTPATEPERDHPRLCGEKQMPRRRSHPPEGSPPPMRGKALDEILRDCRRRITPAYAGKSRRHLKLLLEIEDHPRLCGEKFSSMSEVDIISGSPPPMRGKVRMADATILTKGITPAYAGKSHVRRLQRVQSGDHPRLCGEKFRTNRFTCSNCGITPAYAGKSTKNSCCSSMSEDHPRLCGEKSTDKHLYQKGSGSPPPMRGKDGDSVHSRLPFRITPAYAGKSDPFSQNRFYLRDHPRLCGEKPFLPSEG